MACAAVPWGGASLPRRDLPGGRGAFVSSVYREASLAGGGYWLGALGAQRRILVASSIFVLLPFSYQTGQQWDLGLRCSLPFLG